jgi:hypothetical protein
MKLHGPQGEVNGALLQDGTILRLPPPAADRLATLLQPGQSLVAEGTVVASTIGKVFAAQQIGASRDQLSLVEAPRGRDPGRRAALPPGPPPAPVDGPGLPPPSQR